MRCPKAFRQTLLIVSCWLATIAHASPANLDRPAPPVRSACAEPAEIDPDIFGFTAGADVAAPGPWGAALEYGGAFGTRGGTSSSHGLKAQMSGAPVPCLEIGPSLFAAHDRIDKRLAGSRETLRQAGAALEIKYKLLSRARHGFGLTIAAEHSIAAGTSSLAGRSAPPSARNSGVVAASAVKLLIDRAIVPGRLYGALNLEFAQGWTSARLGMCGTAGFCASSGLAVRGALSLQLAKNLFIGLEAAHLRSYEGPAANIHLGHAWFAGPNLLWRPNDRLAIQVAWSQQLFGHATGSAGKLNLRDFNRYSAKLKIGMSF